MIFIITLLRKSWNVKMAQIYYAENTESKPESSIISYTNALSPLPTLLEQETYQIDLTLSEEELFRNLNKSSRTQIKQASTKSFTHCVEEHPSNEELLNFQRYYNHFAKDKNTSQCNSFHLKTLQLLRDQNALIVTKILNNQNEVFGYRVYVTDSIRSLNFYAVSHFRQNDLPEIKRLYSLASRYLIWENIMWFKQNGYATYDFGSLTNDENIRQFKRGFGGEVVKAYSGYASNNRVGKFVLWMRKIKMSSPYKNR